MTGGLFVLSRGMDCTCQEKGFDPLDIYQILVPETKDKNGPYKQAAWGRKSCPVHKIFTDITPPEQPTTVVPGTETHDHEEPDG